MVGHASIANIIKMRTNKQQLVILIWLVIPAALMKVTKTTAQQTQAMRGESALRPNTAFD